MSDHCGCGRYGCTCVDYSIDNVTASNDDFILRMRHLKCRVTRLVRNQMRKSMSESRETNYSSYPASSKSSLKSVNNKATQLSSSSSINLDGNKVIDHTNTPQLTATSQEYTTNSSIRNYSTSSVEESKPAVVPTQQTNRKQPIGHSTVINPTISTRINRGSDVQRSNVPHDIAVIHPPAPAPAPPVIKMLPVPKPIPKPIPSPTTQSVAIETLPNMSDLTEYTPSDFYQHDNTMVDSSTQATSQVTTSTQATDSINRATSTAKIQTDLITSTTTTATTTTRNTTTFIGIIYDGLISILSFLYRIKKMIFMILLMGLVLWAAVIYGAILGAAICTKTGGYPLFQITLPPSKPVFF